MRTSVGDNAESSGDLDVNCMLWNIAGMVVVRDTLGKSVGDDCPGDVVECFTLGNSNGDQVLGDTLGNDPTVAEAGDSMVAGDAAITSTDRVVILVLSNSGCWGNSMVLDAGC